MRIYLDGCFDLTHYGHFNAMRLAKQLGSHLTVGVLSDEDIAMIKVPPVLTLEERCDMVQSVRWVDALVPDAPAVLDYEATQQLRKDFGITMVVHADDECVMPDGSDPYRGPKNAGMFWVIPRTGGVSTTDLVAALLTDSALLPCVLPLKLPTWEFKLGTVYVDGAFDCLHVGHLAFLKEARKHGTRVVVGVHADDVVAARRGAGPVMCVLDRARALADCRYVDGVLPGSPPVLTHNFLEAIGATRVARGAVHETCVPDRDRYKDVSAKLVYILSPSDVTLSVLRRRIVQHKDEYERKCRTSKFWQSP